MTKRERFVQMISYGPSKLPVSFILEAFDIVEKESSSPLFVNETTDSLAVPLQIPPQEPLPEAVPDVRTLMGDTKRGVELQPAMAEEPEQENAGPIEEMKKALEKGKGKKHGR